MVIVIISDKEVQKSNKLAATSLEVNCNGEPKPSCCCGDWG